MAEKEIDYISHARPPLDEETRQRCRNILEDLFVLYEETNPIGCTKTEHNKNQKAIDALMKVGIISNTLSEWAEDHLFGVFYNAEKSDKNNIDKVYHDLHQHEMLWYEDGLFNEDDLSEDESLSYTRKAVAKILHYTDGRPSSGTWRWLLSKALKALNEGQVKWLLTPLKTRKKGGSFDLLELKIAAIKHVYRLMGEGYPKYVAQEYIIEKQFGIKRESLRAWERQLIAIGALKKESLKSLKEASEFIYLNNKSESPISNSEIELRALYSISQNNEKASNSEGVMYAKNQNYKFSEDIKESPAYPIELALSIMSLSSLIHSFPLDTLSERMALSLS